jgi:hypothetical protein
MKDDPAHQPPAEYDQDRENEAPDDGHPPLTEAQRIQSLRRRRKLAHVCIGTSDLRRSLNVALQLFGAEPPFALYKVASPFEDRPASSNTVESERMKTYLSLSPSDLLSGLSDHPNAPSISISFPSFNSTVSEVDPFQEYESDGTSSVPPSNSDHDSAAQDPFTPLDDDATAAFRRRRLRAAKLSRFFGVAYNDLSIPLAVPESESESGHQTEIEIVASAEEVGPGVKIQDRGWFWNRAESGQSKVGGYEADMSDVIALLRQMPRA